MSAALKLVGTPGSTHLNIPMDVAGAEVPQDDQDHFHHPMEPDAFQYWRNGFQRHLPLSMVLAFAKYLKRPLRLDETKMLVGNDGDEVACAATGKKFQPIFWVQPFKQLLDRIAHHGDVIQALNEVADQVIEFGNFFTLNGLFEEPTPVSGCPYFVGKDGYSPDKNSPLVMAARKFAVRRSNDNGLMWGLSRREIQKRRERVEEQQRARQVAAHECREQERKERLLIEARLNRLMLREPGTSS